jgi:hypothetical protein
LNLPLTNGFDGMAYQTCDGPMGQPIFHSMGKSLLAAFKTQVDLPRQPAVHAITVPKQHAIVKPVVSTRAEHCVANTKLYCAYAA